MQVDLSPQISIFNEFFTTIYKPRIDDLLMVYPTQKSLLVSFADLEKFDPDAADALLSQPDLLIQAAEEAIMKLNLSVTAGKTFTPHVRFIDIPTEDKLIEQLTSKSINEMVAFKCVVTKRAEVMHRVKVAMYRCQLCDAEIRLIVGKNFTPPKRCDSCKKFALAQVEDESTYTDIQRAEVQELLERVRGGAPAAHIELLMDDDIVNKIAPGDNIEVIGILRLKPPLKPRQKQDMIYGRYVEVNSVKSLKRDFEEIEISKEDERRLRELSRNPQINEILAKSIAPSIYGHNEVKKALALQLFGGTKGKVMKGGAPIRDDIHILLIGDPGIAKSRFLQSVSDIAPKSIYVSGKSVSGAGLTVSAEKDELGEGGWTLKAGALVLASGGTAQVDEFDKIEEEDRAAMHEAMESQSYHFSTKIMLSDGREVPIGELVESHLEKNKDKIIRGRNCVILKEGVEDIELLTSDFQSIKSIKPMQISKHKAPDHFIKITLRSGRIIMVTPEHPIWILDNGAIKTKPAEELNESDYTLMPHHIPLKVSIPCVEPEFFKFLGYHITDAGYELNRGKKSGINVYNKDDDAIEDYHSTVSALFHVPIHSTLRASTGVKAERIVSMGVSRSIEIAPMLIEKGTKKHIPPQFIAAPMELISALLRAVFDGDGTFTGHHIGLIGENRVFIEQIQLLLLRFGIKSHIFVDGKMFRLTITGKENIERYNKSIGFLSKKKMGRVKEYLKKDPAFRNTSDVIPNCSELIVETLGALKIHKNEIFGYGIAAQKNGFSFTLKNCMVICKYIRGRITSIKKGLSYVESNNLEEMIKLRKKLNISQYDLEKYSGIKRATISYWEVGGIYSDRYQSALKETMGSMLRIEPAFSRLERFVFGDIGVVGIRNVERIENRSEEWVYDIAAGSTQAFISECAVLHNSISVAKAGIVAKFRTKTAILAAANPKYGRFDQTKNLSDQFNIPPTLLSRFDLIFPIVDVLDEEKDAKLAEHILSTHMGTEKDESQVFDRDLLRKYIAYARRKAFPKLTIAASGKIKEFYVDLRRKSKDSGSVAITPRYLEGLVRLAEANAKMRLSETVEESDADVATSLFNYVMMQIMTDKVTGAFDVDVVATGKSKSDRDKAERVDTMMQIIREILRKSDTAELERIISDAKSYDIDEATARKIITELLRKGEVYEVAHGHLKIVGE